MCCICVIIYVRDRVMVSSHHHLAQSCDRLITVGMSGAVVPLLQAESLEALQLLAELGRRSLEMPAPGAKKKGWNQTWLV